MNGHDSDFLSFRRCAGILVGFLLVVSGSLYFFNVSAQTDAAEKQTAEQNLVSGKPAFTGFTPPNRSFNDLSSNHSGNFEMSGICQNGKCVRNGKIAFQRNGDIYTVNPDGTNWTNIASGAAQDTSPNWSPDGFKIAFASNRDGNSEIYRMNGDGSNPTRLTNNTASDTSPYYSPDGSTIVFVSNRDGNEEIYKMNADGSNQIRLTNDAGIQRFPAFSPDGQKILYVSGVFNSSSNPLNLYTMNADGSNQQPIPGPAVPSQQYRFPSYSPDGSKIIFTYTEEFVSQHPRTWTMNADGSNRVLFSTTSPTGGFLNHLGSYSPDGTKVVSTNIQSQAGQRNFLLVSNSDGSSVQGFDVDIVGIDAADWQPILVIPHTLFDYDGDGRADVSVFRASENKWYILQSSILTVREKFFAIADDIPVPADYDGDGKTDLAVFRPASGDWWYLSSINNAQISVNFGQAGDIPRPSDFDGDGKTDYVLYRPSNSVWYRYGSTGVTSVIAFGIAEDKPLVGDFDGDGKSDPAVFRPSTGNWWYASSVNGQFISVHWGASGDIPVPGDYDADGKTDFVVFRPSDGGWYILYTTGSYTIATFGTVGDKPVAADYDGDGRADIAVFRPSTGTWYLLQTTSGFGAVNFGVSSDVPTENAFVP
ncbi:MAG TPA: FG-GAP-like repeat-containing protein [Pyrinomonadaceae bacterium]|nr:FG-GAP-like repeat-containing protein [Pyrinomonadaceae bacterium]